MYSPKIVFDRVMVGTCILGIMSLFVELYQSPGIERNLEAGGGSSSWPLPLTSVCGSSSRLPSLTLDVGSFSRLLPLTTHPRSGAAAKRSNPTPRSCGCVGAGRPRGATPRSRTEEVAMRRYPSSKVRSSGCTLLEQP